jgi:stage II sporulation protein D
LRRILILAALLDAAAVAKELRIGVFGLFHPAELVLRAAPASPLRISVAGTEWRLEGPGTARFRAGRSGVLCISGDRVSSSAVVRVSGPRAKAEFVLGVPGKIERRFVGSLEIHVRAGELVPVVIADLETAVASVVAAESAPGAPIEALEAQAIAARSYYLASSARHRGFEFCDTTHCQFLREPPAGAAAAAASATQGLVLRHRGAPLAALFSASCGGRTRTLAEAGMPTEGYPYYAVECPPCRRSASRWKRSLPSDFLAQLEDRTEARRLELGRVFGWSVLPGYNYQVRREGGRILIDGRGEGHGIGLCQHGASAMAAAGADHRQILSYYYPNTVIDFAK